MIFLEDLARGCLPFLYFLRDIANPILDFIFAAITYIGSEIAFLVIAILVFWCVNKREGYYLLIIGLVGSVANQIMKLAFRVPRPWVLDPDFKSRVVADAIPEATGYSFPSGHTQNVTGTLGSIAMFNKKRWLSITLIAVIVLVSFSRMYLGVHTLLDVVVSLIFASVLVIVLHPFFKTEEKFNKSFPYIVVGSVIISFAFLVYVLILSGDKSLDEANYNSGLENACTLLGCILGFIAVYFIDTRFTNFKTEAKWYAQVIKLTVGLLIALGIKLGLSTPLTLFFGNEYVARTVRYFLIVCFAGILWPLTFGWFSRLDVPALNRLGEKVKSVFTSKKTT